MALDLLMDGQAFLVGLLRPWNFYQVCIAIGLALLAYLLKRWLAPKLPTREKDGVPLWQAQIMATIKSRLGAMLFLVLIWGTVFVMREATWPSRSYLLGIVGNLTLAWLIVGLATQLIPNRALRRVVTWAAWAWITLRILRLTDESVGLLDSIAIDTGGMRISVWLVLQAFGTVAVFFAIARFVSVQSTERVQRNEDISPSMRVLIVKVLQLILYAGAFFLGLRAVGVDLSGLAILSGAIGVGLGFGLQKVVSNLVSGVIILLDKSIKPGDVISIGETFGWVNALGARYVSITTRDGKEYLVPNEDLITGQVVNWSHSNDFVRLDIHFGTSYGDDPHSVRALAIQAAQNTARVLPSRAPVCHITGFGDSSVDYILRFWITDPTEGLTNIRGNVYQARWDAFQENDISIPFPQREMRMLGNGRAPIDD
ncbi:MAG: mechanosensitive ion channel domain-containing protein [Pseudomonadota bacterium]